MGRLRLILVLFTLVAAGASGPAATFALGLPPTDRTSALHELAKLSRSGAPFTPQEVEILDAFEAGLPISDLEAEVVLSRAIHDLTVAGTPADGRQRELLESYRAWWREHGRDVVARNALLNADQPAALGTSSPDGRRDWELYADPELYNQLSSAYQRRLQAWFGRRGRLHRGAGAAATSVNPASVLAIPPNTLVNDPTADATTRDTQSGAALVAVSGSTILCSFNDSGSNVGNAAHFTGIARSTDGGATWADQGGLPNDANGDAGYPSFARSTATATIILATLGYNSSATIPTFRSFNNGATYLSQVDADGGGTNNDKEWIACDNFAGAGNGNFYLIYRDFGVGGGMSFTRSINDGAAWSSRILLSSNLGNLGWVVVGADHAVYCFWLNTPNTVVFRKSTNQGLTFGALTTVAVLRSTGVLGNLGLSGGFRTNASLQVVAHPTDPNQLYAVWNDKGVGSSTDKANVYFSQTTDGGTTWSPPIQVNTDAGTHDNWHPVLAITPDGTGLFTSWYDRRLDPGNAMIDAFARHATISGTTVTFGPDYRVTDTAFPVVIGQDPGVNLVYLSDYEGAIADNTTYYRTWGDNRLAHLSHTHQPDVRFTRVPKAGPGAIAAAAGSSLSAECAPPNGAIDPNETVTVNLNLTNIGTASSTNLVATLQPTGGVTAPSGPQSFGSIPVAGVISRPFTFTATGTCQGTLTATLQLQDGVTNLGTATYTFTLGATPPVFTYSSGAVAVPIPATGTSGEMTPQVISVPDPGNVFDVDVRIRLNHTFDGDLRLTLVSPNGTSVVLSNQRGANGDNFGSGSNDCSGTFTVFDDAVPATIVSGTAPFEGSYRPDSPLSAFNGSPANGNWTLRISDLAGGDSGALFCWQLAIRRVALSCNACSPVAVEAANRPPAFAVWQNRPNPFGTTTSIRYTLPLSAPVTLSVYNVQGRRVATLVQTMQGPGEYTASFGPGAVTATGERVGPLPAGTYFYQLRAGDFVSARKMLLLR